MSKKLYEEANISDIADAIREKNGTTNTYTVAQMPSAVRAIETQPDLETLNVISNGTYLPSAGKDGFSEVAVNVPNSYTNSDEGKVVKNGSLISQTPRAAGITENGTYDTTENNSVVVNVPAGSGVVQSLSVTQNGTYNPPSGVDGYAPVTVNVSGGGGGNSYTNSEFYQSDEQITDILGFTALYSSSIRFGNYGQKVAARLAIADESAHSTLQASGWNANGMAYYDIENIIGAYGGYDFGEEIIISKAKFWLNRYSGQNNTLIVTIEYLDGYGNWNEIKDIEISTTFSYPSCISEVQVQRKIHGIRWIHKKGPKKSVGNNITFVGMSVYRGVGQPINIYIPNSSGLIMPPSGYDGFGPLFING